MSNGNYYMTVILKDGEHQKTDMGMVKLRNIVIPVSKKDYEDMVERGIDRVDFAKGDIDGGSDYHLIPSKGTGGEISEWEDSL